MFIIIKNRKNNMKYNLLKSSNAEYANSYELEIEKYKREREREENIEEEN
jgi:hypothetical protein